MKREYFLGGNTNKGFFSYYDYLAEGKEFNKIYIIKGGPGTGKSTTMKAVGKWGEDHDFDVDYVHCSSDPYSLDGVIIKEIGIAMVDGTAPHIVDPKNAGAVEVVVNMGEFWDENAIREHKAEIMQCNKEISEHFAKAYNYLAAAGNLQCNCRLEVEEEKVAAAILDILNNIPEKSEKGCGKVRKLFSEAVTPEGIISYADGFKYENKVVIKSEITGEGRAVTKKLKSKLIERGYDLELFYSPFDPSDEIRHIIVPELNLCVITSDFLSLVDERKAMLIDVDEMAEKKSFGADFLRNRLLMMTMIQQAIRAISSAKRLHDKLEGYYVPNINFDAMEKCREKIFKELEQFAQ